MHLTKLVSAAVLGAAWIPAAVGDAEFEQVRIKNLNDYSNKATDPAQKYFRTSIVPVLFTALVFSFSFETMSAN